MTIPGDVQYTWEFMSTVEDTVSTPRAYHDELTKNDLILNSTPENRL